MKALSKNNIELNLSVPIMVTVASLIIGLVYIKEISLSNLLIILSVLILGCLWTYKVYSKVYNVFFDEDLLILKNRKLIRKIDLDKIKKIKLTLSDLRIMGIQFYEYKIEFINELDQYETIKLFISNLNKILWQFQDLTQEKSPKVIIENHTSSWEK